MPHPFFNAIKFPWHLREAVAFRAALAKAIGPENIQNLCDQATPNFPILAEANSTRMWTEALNLLPGAGLEKLCELILGDADLIGIHEATLAVRNAMDAIESVVTLPQVAFVDRKELRARLKLVSEQPDPGILLVRGGPRRGKSWTIQLVRHVSKQMGADCNVIAEPLATTAQQVLNMLFAPFPDFEPPNLGTDNAWYQTACTRLISAGQKSQRVTWIVIDDLNGGLGDSMIMELVGQLGAFMQNGVFSQWFRLVFIDYPDGDTPTKWMNHHWCEDRPDPTHIDQPAIAEFLITWANTKGKQLPDADAQRIAADVLANAAAHAAQAGPATCGLESIQSHLRMARDQL